MATNFHKKLYTKSQMTWVFIKAVKTIETVTETEKAT